MIKLSTNVVLLFLLLFTTQNADAEDLSYWSYEGLGQYQAQKVIVNGGNIYTCTDSGFFKKSLLSADTIWTSLGFEGKYIWSFLIISSDTMLIGIDPTSYGADTISIFKSVNGGMDWQPFQNGFGGELYTGRAACDFGCAPHQSDTLFVANHNSGIGRSLDGGLSWVPVFGDWGDKSNMYDVAVNPYYPNKVYTGTFGVGHICFFYISSDYGITWDPYLTGGLFLGMTYEFDPLDSNHFYFNQAGLRETFDGGWTFNSVPEPIPCRSFVIHPDSSNIFYVTHYSHGGALRYFKSYDTCNSWVADSNPDMITHEVYDLTIAVLEDRTILAFGTHDGVYFHTDIESWSCGDANFDRNINVSDAVYIINYVFVSGNAPMPYESGNVNCDASVNISDAVYIINYVFSGGNDPCDTDGDDIPDC